MPISDEALQNEKNHFIAVRGEATVGQALGALKGLGGQAWWHLVVQMKDGSWGVTRFSGLSASLEGTKNAAEIHLSDLQQLTSTSVVERDRLETRAAQQQARKSPGGLLIVTDDGLPIGILVEGGKRGGIPISSAGLNELGGKYVNLKDIGSILLSSSRRRAKGPKPSS